MRWQVILVLILVEIIYLVVGALVFWALEAQPNVTSSTPLNLSQLADEILANDTCLTRTELLSILEIVQANTTAAHGTSPKSWSYGSSLFFAMTVVTSIGYGNVYPTNGGCRAFCCVYAIIGIPLTLVLLYGIGEKFKYQSKRFDERLLSRWPRASKIARSIVIFIPGFCLFLLIPSIAFWQLETWTYDISLYYSLITLSTIGFGDYVAGYTCNQDAAGCIIYRICVGIWIFLGLAWLAGVISSIQDMFMEVVEKVDTKVVDERNKHKQKSEASKLSQENSDDYGSTQLCLTEKALDDTANNQQVEEVSDVTSESPDKTRTSQRKN